MTKHIRGRIRKEGVEARVSLYTSCGTKCIRVIPIAADKSWSGEEARKICIVASANNLYGSMKSTIDYSFERWANSGATNFQFEFHG